MKDAHTVVEYGMLKTSPKYKLHSRLKQIRRGLLEYITRHSCKVMVLEEFSFSLRRSGMSNSIVVAKAHGAIQTLPCSVKMLAAGTVTKPQKKRDQAKKKIRALRLVKKLYGIELPLGQHHIADAIIQGRYYFTGERL